MKITETFLTKNPCYIKGQKLKAIQGLMLHSVGCAQPKASAFINTWNSPSYNRACVHAFIDANDGVIYQTLPWNYFGWHCGGSGNSTHIGVEMCEPDCIKYTGGTSIKVLNKEKAQSMVQKTYNSAVELFAYLCIKYNLDPLKKGVIVSHKEGHSLRIATNHGDPEHLWKGVGLNYTMDTFRKDVAEHINKDNKNSEKPKTEKPSASHNKSTGAQEFKVKTLVADLCIRTGPGIQYVWTGRYTGNGIFTIVEEKDGWGKLKTPGLGWISLAYCKRV